MDLTYLRAEAMRHGTNKPDVIPAGILMPQEHLTPWANPTLRLETPDLKTLLDTISIPHGKWFDEDSFIYLQEHAEEGGFLTGETHPARRFRSGWMQILEISVSQDEEEGATAVCAFDVLQKDDNPIVESQTVDLATVVEPVIPGDNDSFRIRNPWHNSTEIPGCKDMVFRPNNERVLARSSPGCFADLCSVVANHPEFVFTFEKLDEFDATTFTGQNVVGSWEVYLQQSDPRDGYGDQRLARDQAKHIKFDFETGNVGPEEVEVNVAASGEYEVTVRPTGQLNVSTVDTIPV